MARITLLIDLKMITKETPYKLSEIIRDTWPGLYRRPMICDKDNKSNKSK